MSQFQIDIGQFITKGGETELRPEWRLVTELPGHAQVVLGQVIADAVTRIKESELPEDADGDDLQELFPDVNFGV